MKLSDLSETLIGSEIVKLGGEIREKIRQGQRIYNFTVGDFDPAIFPIPKELEEEIIKAYREHFTNYPAECQIPHKNHALLTVEQALNRVLASKSVLRKVVPVGFCGEHNAIRVVSFT